MKNQSIRLLTLRAYMSATLKAVVAAAVLAAFAGCLEPAAAQIGSNHWSREKIEFTIDVAEDMLKFVEHRVQPGEQPLRGSFFVTEGRIYPAGAISGDTSQFDPNA